MTQFILNIWLTSVFGSLFLVGFLLAKPLRSHRVSKNIQYWMLLLILVRFLWIAPVTIGWGNPSPVMTYKNQLTTQIQKPVENIQETFTPAVVEQTSASVQQEAVTPVQQSSFVFQLQWLWVVFPLVSVGMFLYHCVGYRRFCRLLQQTYQPPSPMAAQLFDIIRKQMGVSKAVRLVETPVLSSPLCIGLLRPVVVMPTGIATEEDLRQILYHELTHQKHKDVWVKWLTLLAVSLHFFNPFVYWLRKELNLYGSCGVTNRSSPQWQEMKNSSMGNYLSRWRPNNAPLPVGLLR